MARPPKKRPPGLQPFDKLTSSQLVVFEQIAINNDSGHNQRTLDLLVRRGLIEEYHERQAVIFKIRRYRVPVGVHRAWCRYCDLAE